MWNAGWEYYFVMLFYLLFASLTVMNMLVGILCEVIAVVAAAEKEESKVKEVKFKLRDLIKKLDVDRKDVVSKRMFGKMLDMQEAIVALEVVGVDIVALVESVDHVFH